MSTLERALLWPGSVSLTRWPHGPRVVLKPMFEESAALGNKVNPPRHVRDSQKAAVAYSVWRRLKSHFGLSRSITLVDTRQPPPDQRRKAVSISCLLTPGGSCQYIT